MVGFKRLTELCEGLFGLTISQRAGAAALGDLPQSDERVPLGMGRQGLRRPLLRGRHRPPRRPHRPDRHPRRSHSPRAQANRRPIRWIGVSNYVQFLSVPVRWRNVRWRKMSLLAGQFLNVLCSRQVLGTGKRVEGNTAVATRSVASEAVPPRDRTVCPAGNRRHLGWECQHERLRELPPRTFHQTAYSLTPNAEK